MSEEINKIFEQWKQFLSWCYENNDKTAEIHRDSLERVMAYTKQLENIRKETIEYIKTCNDKEKLESMFLDESYISNYGAIELLKILGDKE